MTRQMVVLQEPVSTPSQQEFWSSLVYHCEQMDRVNGMGLRRIAQHLGVRRNELRDIYKDPETVSRLPRWKLVLIIKRLQITKDDKGELFVQLELFRPSIGGNVFKHRKKYRKRHCEKQVVHGLITDGS